MSNDTKGSINEELNKCCRYDSLQAGKSLVKFITNVDTVTSEIGEYRKSGRLDKEKKGFIVTGLQLERSMEPTHILSTTDTTVEINSVFSQFRDIPPIQLVKEYLKTIDKSVIKNTDIALNDYKKAVIEKLKFIGNNKNLIVPFKPGDECRVNVKNGSNEYKDKEAIIKTLSWGLDRETGKFKSYVIVLVKNVGYDERVFKMELNEYGDRFKVVSVEKSVKTGCIDRDIISMDRFGLIKPIEIKDSAIKIAIDNANIYMELEDVNYIVGSWENNGEIRWGGVVDSLKKHKVYECLERNKKFISKHRRFIAPYKLVKSNEIQL